MKKLIILLLIIPILSSCNYVDFTQTLYITSYYLDYSENEYKGVFYSPSSASTGKSENETSEDSYIANTNAKDISSLFNMVDLSFNLSVNFKHVKSVILSKNLLNEHHLDEYINYIKECYWFNYNFCVFVTEEEGSDIYNVKNPNGESALDLVIMNPTQFDYLYSITCNKFFLAFAEAYLNNRIISLPALKVNDVWKDAENYYVKGAYFLNSSNEIYYSDDYQEMVLLKSHKYVSLKFMKEQFFVNEYKVQYLFKDKIIMKVTCDVLPIISNINYNEVRDFFIIELNKTKDKITELDILDIKTLNYRYNKQYTYDDMIISLDIKK